MDLGTHRGCARDFEHAGTSSYDREARERSARSFQGSRKLFCLPARDSHRRPVGNQPDCRRSGGSWLSRLHVFSDPAASWLDHGDTDYRIDVLLRSSTQPRLCDIRLRTVFLSDQCCTRVARALQWFDPSFNFPARSRRFSSYPDSLRFGRLIFGDARVDNRF
jgi:hypothetical protein